MKVFVYFIGKARDEHSNAIAEEFLKRTSRWVPCQMREVDPRKFDLAAKHPSALKVMLDPAGRTMDSAKFIALVERTEQEGRDMAFLLGGHDGLPEGWKKSADLLLSLSMMTFPHELARAMLTEQIYRGFATLRGHPYPR